MSFEVEGFDELIRALGKLTPQIEQAAAQVVAAETKQVLEDSRKRIPVRTGRLRRSGKRKVRILPRKKRIEGQVSYGDRRAFYGAIVEHQNPYLKPSINRDRFRQRLEARIGSVLGKAFSGG